MEENKSESPDGQEASGSETQEAKQEQDKLAFLQAEAQKAFKARDELKAKLKSLEEADEMKKGNYEKVIADKTQEFEQLKAEAEELKQIKEKFDSFQKAMKDELLAELSDEHKAIAGDLELDKLREYVKLNKATTNSMDTARTGGSGAIDVTGKKWDDLNREELIALKKSAPHKYNMLYEAKYGRLH
ncbi:MAG: hypothetical protein IPG99_20060 [Ignavibacteria bacterium]|nr:hypothetical protein [Ignavibacteria bacterium]